MKKTAPSQTVTATDFTEALQSYVSPAEGEKLRRYFKHGEGDVFIGVRMGHVFALAKACMAMPPGEIEQLLESPVHEVRAGAVSIMDWQARDKKTTPERRKELYELYLRRHDRINNWDLVDRSAQFVIGSYLFDKPRKVLYQLARSRDPWERRTAIVSTAYFLRKRETEDTFKIAEMLVNDGHDLIQKAYGGWIREAGKQDKPGLLAFLDEHAATMPRTALRYAVEHLDPKLRKHYMELRSDTSIIKSKRSKK